MSNIIWYPTIKPLDFNTGTNYLNFAQELLTLAQDAFSTPPPAPIVSTK